MNIYFACSITGGRQFEGVYKDLAAAMLADGHDVPTAHLAETTVIEVEAVVSPLDVYQRDVEWIEQADALIAEVSVPSHGVGYEIGFALNAGKRVLCISQQGRKVSKMVSGNPHPNLTVRTYRDNEEAIQLVRRFIEQIQQQSA